MSETAGQRPRGTLATGGALDRIIEAKARRLAEAKTSVPFKDLKKRCESVEGARPRRSLIQNLSGSEGPNIIAEIKRRSPSKGVIREQFDPAMLAEGYERGGAKAISVLAEEDFFDGSLDHIRQARPLVSLPLLRKDFIFDEYQLYEALEAGADAVLLIVAALDDELLLSLTAAAAALGLDPLVEAHTEGELDRAQRAGARLIGVNNRNLITLGVDIDTSFRLARLAPPEAVLVSESGIRTVGDIQRLCDAGYKGFLIGEHFMRAEDPGRALGQLIAETNAHLSAGGLRD